VIREARYKKLADLPPYVVKDLVASTRKLPAGSLTHLAVNIDLRGTLVPLPEIEKAGKKALGA
jgi:hypothetical protein